MFGGFYPASVHAVRADTQSVDTMVLLRYERAYGEIAAMLNGSDSICLKRAVFLPEWAYVGDDLSYTSYCVCLDTMARMLRNFITANRLNNIPIGAHIALFEFFVRPYAMNGYKPFDYEFEDCNGDVDFTNTFVTKLMRTHRGQCRSLPLLYKLLANEIEAEAYIAYAPRHTFVRHRNGTCSRLDPFDGADGQKQLPECNSATATPKAHRTWIAYRTFCGAVAQHISRTQHADRPYRLCPNTGTSARGQPTDNRCRDRTT